jgi:hypothetical protein
LIITGAITVVPLPASGASYEIIIGIAFAVAGVRALPGSARTAPAAQSATLPS